jgi:hypothetical protein
MKYHAPTDQFTIAAADLKLASRAFRWAIKHIREGHGLDTKGYQNDGPMGDPHFAECGILDGARALGIDLGADRAGELDVSSDG